MCDPSAFWKQGHEHTLLIFFIHIPCSITHSPFAWTPHLILYGNMHYFTNLLLVLFACFTPAALWDEVEFQCHVRHTLPCLHDGSNAHSSSDRISGETLKRSMQPAGWSHTEIPLLSFEKLLHCELVAFWESLFSFLLREFVWKTCLEFEKSDSSAGTKLFIYGCM